MRVAVTLEQCWHKVPGGTARATLDAVAAVAARGDVDQIGVRARHRDPAPEPWRSEEHTSELQSLMRSSYAVFCLKKKTQNKITTNDINTKVQSTQHVKN